MTDTTPTESAPPNQPFEVVDDEGNGLNQFQTLEEAIAWVQIWRDEPADDEDPPTYRIFQLVEVPEIEWPKRASWRVADGVLERYENDFGRQFADLGQALDADDLAAVARTLNDRARRRLLDAARTAAARTTATRTVPRRR